MCYQLTFSLLKEKNIELNISKIKLDDQNIFKLLSSGHTVGLFQLESAGMRDALVNMKPNKFEALGPNRQKPSKTSAM